MSHTVTAMNTHMSDIYRMTTNATYVFAVKRNCCICKSCSLMLLQKSPLPLKKFTNVLFPNFFSNSTFSSIDKDLCLHFLTPVPSSAKWVNMQLHIRCARHCYQTLCCCRLLWKVVNNVWCLVVVQWTAGDWFRKESCIMGVAIPSSAGLKRLDCM